MDAPTVSAATIEALEDRHKMAAKLAADTVHDTLKFYSSKERFFRRSIFASAGEMGSQRFNISSLMIVSALRDATTTFTGAFSKQELAKIERVCQGVLSRYLDKRYVYASVSSTAFGDFSPLTSSLLLKELLRMRGAVDLTAPAFRLAFRIVVAYLLTGLVEVDLAQVQRVFGPKSMWSLKLNHPMVMFRCVDALSSVSQLVDSGAVETKRYQDLLSPMREPELRQIANSMPKSIRRPALARLRWINRECVGRYAALGGNPVAVREALASLMEELGSTVTSWIDREVAKQQRRSRVQLDSSSLAGLIGVAAIASPSVSASARIDDLQALFQELGPGGTWPNVLPFFFDDLGGAYHSVSVEMGYVALRAILVLDAARGRLSMDHVYDTLHEKFQPIYGWIEGARKTLTVAGDVRLFTLDETITRHCRGWASDRSPGIGRLDGWMGAIVLQFLATDAVARKNYMQRLVLSRYQVTPHEECKPSWKNMIDPDSGSGSSVMQRLERECLIAKKSDRCVSVLLYGPPGTAKTSLVKAMAHERKADLLQLSSGDFVQNGLELLEQTARRIFRDLARLEDVVVLFDEMDPLIKAREFRLKEGGTSIADYVITGMLPKLQDLHDHCIEANMMFAIATNFRDTVDSAVSRRGRVDMECMVLPHTRKARREQLTRFLAELLDGEDVGTRKWKPVLDASAERSGLMVYRELESLAREMVKVYRGQRQNSVRNLLDAEGVAEVLGTRNIRPESYSREARPNAGAEFLCLVRRLLGVKLPSSDVLGDPVRRRRLFQRAQRELSERGQESDIMRHAGEVVGQWCE